MLKVGIAALFEDLVFNDLRDIELKLANLTGNWRALQQPPHTTLKRPFEIESLEEFALLKIKLDKLFQTVKEFEVSFGSVSAFGTGTIYQSICTHSDLRTLHQNIVSVLDELGIEYNLDFEADQFVHHTTLATSLAEVEFDSAYKYMCDNDILDNTSTTISKIGLFLNIDNNQHWVVVHEYSIST